ncbi:DUF3592 domain-containing protein [Nostoc sp.]|uniref:DUF3592 domain-containing protein n=1 Tax=Nostoc sp. TaxID=1180 RepID=UPI003FA53580
MDSISRRDRSSTNNEEKETYYAPVIEFLVNGKRTRFTVNYESYCSSNGHQVVVRYDPKQPINTAHVVNPLEGCLVGWASCGF